MNFPPEPEEPIYSPGPVPEEFRRSFRRHNRNARLAAFACLVGAIVTWGGAYTLCAAAALLVQALRQQDSLLEGIPFPDIKFWWQALPWEFHVGFACVAVVLLLWGALDAWRRRYRPINDRKILGLHVVGDILLIPVRLTYGVWSHLGLVIRLDQAGLIEAFEVLRHVWKEKKCPIYSLGGVFADSYRLQYLLSSLQWTGWLSIVRGKDDWFYVIPSEEEKNVNRMMGVPSAS